MNTYYEITVTWNDKDLLRKGEETVYFDCECLSIGDKSSAFQQLLPSSEIITIIHLDCVETYSIRSYKANERSI